MRINNILKEKDVGSYNKLTQIKNRKSSEKLSEREIKELMAHSSYKRHKGAVKQVK